MSELSSDISSAILKRQFGETSVDILYQNERTRIICTKAESGQVLELSYVAFNPTGAERFPEVHDAIRAGESMGQAFQGRDIAFLREIHAAYNYPLPPHFESWFKSQKPATVVAVSIFVGSENTPYAEILETYSPDVQWPKLRGEPETEQVQKINELNEFLGKLATS